MHGLGLKFERLNDLKFGTTALVNTLLFAVSHSTQSVRFVLEILCPGVLVYCNNYRMSSLLDHVSVEG